MSEPERRCLVQNFRDRTWPFGSTSGPAKERLGVLRRVTMKTFRSSPIRPGAILALTLALYPAGALAAPPSARVTHVVREVNLLPRDAQVRPAKLNDLVQEGIAVRTGSRSRSELTFPDITITRLGANTVFTFDRGGRGVDLSGGSVLLRVPKGSGAANVRTSAVSVAVTGTTLILESGRGGQAKLIVLEGSTRLSLVRYPNQSRVVLGGQMLEVPAGAQTLPMPKNINLNQVMKTHPLITGFRPLPSRDLIAAAAQNPPRSAPDDEPIYQGQLVDEPPRQPRGPTISINPGIGIFTGSRPPRGGRRPGGQGPVSQPTPPPNPNQTPRIR